MQLNNVTIYFSADAELSMAVGLVMNVTMDTFFILNVSVSTSNFLFSNFMFTWHNKFENKANDLNYCPKDIKQLLSHEIWDLELIFKYFPNISTLLVWHDIIHQALQQQIWLT